MRTFVNKLVRAKISLPAFMWVISSSVIAGYILFQRSVIEQGSFAHDLPINLLWWCGLLLIGDVVCLIGMILKLDNVPLVRLGAMLSFVMWVFGGISLGEGHSWFTMLFLTIPYIINYAYLYLAGSVGLFKKHYHGQIE